MRRTVRAALAGSALALGLAAIPGTAMAADYNPTGGAGGSGSGSGSGVGTTGGTTVIVPATGNGSGSGVGSSGSGGGLPFTGFELGAALAVAGGSIVAGSAAVLGSKRRRRVTIPA